MTNKQLHHFLSDSPGYSNKLHSFPAYPLDGHSVGHLPYADYSAQWFPYVSLNPPRKPVEMGLVSPHLADEETGWRTYVACPGPQNWLVPELGIKLLCGVPAFTQFPIFLSTGWYRVADLTP